MSQESKIRELCDEISHCPNDARSLELVRELRAALHHHIEDVRASYKDVDLHGLLAYLAHPAHLAH